MARYDASSAQCLIYTYKEGLLSAVAHDLEIRVGAFSIDIDDAMRVIEARFDPSSLRVVRAIGSGVSERDRRTIEKNIIDDVLEARRYPEIRFKSTTVTGLSVEGLVALHGRERSVAFDVVEDTNAWRAEVRINQPDYGIKPFTAMLGTLRIRPEVTVRVSITR